MANSTQPTVPAAAPAAADPTDEELAGRARGGDRTAFELLMRRNNRRVYRTIRAVLRDGAEVEDAMQEAYVSAFTHLDQFHGAARWSTWLCRIAYNEALARLRRRKRFVSIDAEASNEGRNREGSGMKDTDAPRTPAPDPERAVADRELARVLEGAIDRLPDIYRAVLMLRQIDGLGVAETAAVLEVAEEVVKTRLHRARALLRAELEERIGAQLDDTYAFGAQRCDRVVAAVLARLPSSEPSGAA
jgi:RNA polymerase sigma-70 factor (ECF subfamily)